MPKADFVKNFLTFRIIAVHILTGCRPITALDGCHVQSAQHHVKNNHNSYHQIRKAAGKSFRTPYPEAAPSY